MNQEQFKTRMNDEIWAIKYIKDRLSWVAEAVHCGMDSMGEQHAFIDAVGLIVSDGVKDIEKALGNIQGLLDELGGVPHERKT